MIKKGNLFHGKEKDIVVFVTEEGMKRMNG